MGAIGTQTIAARGRAGRVAVLLALVFAAGVALRGRLPETRPGPRSGSGDSPFTLAGLIVLLGVSALLTGFALLNGARRQKAAVAAGRSDVPGGLGDGKGRWQLRLVLMVLGLMLASVVAFVVAQQIRLGADFGQDVPVSDVPDGTPAAPPPPPRGRAERDAFWYLVATTAFMTVMIIVSGVVSARKRPRPESAAVLSAGPRAEAPPDPEPLALAAERGLAEVGDLSREPREAIIACYAAMENALADAPGAAPQASDTPTEVLARAVGQRAVSAGNASTLVELFTEARFSRHVMTEGHRDVAEQALRSVLGELRGRR
jgi:hypothetical protein